mmetsp:Transcript_13385/g.14819  ORF Transcript_13385/g.14819 Transcript_13385/m.14819 type:complete len:101 (+) Transcript_13385:46-348(+)
MGAKTTKYLDEIADDIKHRKPLNINHLQKIWLNYDKDDNGHLDGEEMSLFLNEVFDWMWGKITPLVPTTQIPESAIPKDDPRRKKDKCAFPPSEKDRTLF